MRITKKITVSLLILLVLLASMGGLIHWRMNHSLIAVLPGELYRSAEISPQELARIAHRHGIRTVIDLRTMDSDKHDPEDIILEGQALRSVGIRHINLATGQTPDMKAVARFLEILDEPGTRPVLIHCYHGIGRTGVFVALYLMEYAGYSNEDAIKAVAGYYSLRPGGRKGFRQGSNKGDFLLNYEPRTVNSSNLPLPGIFPKISDVHQDIRAFSSRLLIFQPGRGQSVSCLIMKAYPFERAFAG